MNKLDEMKELRSLKKAEKKLIAIRKKATGELQKEMKVAIVTRNFNKELNKAILQNDISYKLAVAIQELVIRNQAYIDSITEKELTN